LAQEGIPFKQAGPIAAAALLDPLDDEARPGAWRRAGGSAQKGGAAQQEVETKMMQAAIVPQQRKSSL
jgi:hypothetical protein